LLITYKKKKKIFYLIIKIKMSHIDRIEELKQVYITLDTNNGNIRIMGWCEWVHAFSWTQESPRAHSAEMQALWRVSSSLGLSCVLWAEGLRHVWSLYLSRRRIWPFSQSFTWSSRLTERGLYLVIQKFLAFKYLAYILTFFTI